MTTSIDLTIAAMGDLELAAFVAAGQAELSLREKRRKEETIAKIRALASEAGLAVSIEGARGRPGGQSPKKRVAPRPEATGASS